MGANNFSPIRGVPNSGASGMFPVGVVLHNRAVEAQHGYVFRAFPGGERPAKASITSNSASLSSC